MANCFFQLTQDSEENVLKSRKIVDKILEEKRGKQLNKNHREVKEKENINRTVCKNSKNMENSVKIRFDSLLTEFVNVL